MVPGEGGGRMSVEAGGRIEVYGGETDGCGGGRFDHQHLLRS